MTVPADSLRLLLVPVVAATLVLSACSAPATDSGTTEPDSGATSEPAPADEATGLNLPPQTIGTDTDCSLYTNEEISALWGVPITDNDQGQVIETGGLGGKLYSCDFNETDSGLGLTVDLEFREYDTEEGAIQYITDIRNAASFNDVVYFENIEVPGLGDEAFFSVDPDVAPENELVVLLYTRTDNLMLLLTASNLDGVKPEYRDLLIETYNLKF